MAEDVANAQESYQKKEDVWPFVSLHDNLYTQLKDNLQKADSFRHNFKIHQMALVGWCIEQDPSRKQDFEEKHVQAFLLLNKLFPEPAAIMHLKEVQPGNFYIKKKYVEYILNSQKRKLDLVCNKKDKSKRGGKRRKVTEGEETQEYFEAWMNDEIVTGSDGLWEYNNGESSSGSKRKRDDDENQV